MKDYFQGQLGAWLVDDAVREQRTTWSQGLIKWGGLACLLVLVFLALPGCAAERYMTAEQDEEMRANCAEHGCTVIPNPIWQQIEALLKRSGAI